MDHGGSSEGVRLSKEDAKLTRRCHAGDAVGALAALQMGANPDLIDRNGRSLLHSAAKGGNADVVVALLR